MSVTKIGSRLTEMICRKAADTFEAGEQPTVELALLASARSYQGLLSLYSGSAMTVEGHTFRLDPKTGEMTVSPHLD